MRPCTPLHPPGSFPYLGTVTTDPAAGAVAEALRGECALAIQNAQMYAVLNERYEGLVEDFHRWFDYASPRG